MLYIIIFAIGFAGASVWAAPPELALILAANIDNLSRFEDHWWATKLAQYQVKYLLPLVLCATAGSTLGSSLHYAVGRVPTRFSGRFLKRIERIDLARFERSGNVLVFVSAAISIPPYTAVCLAAGLVRFPFAHFALASFMGKLARYSLAAYAGEEIGRLFFKGMFS